MSENDFPLDNFEWKLFLGELWFYNADALVMDFNLMTKIHQTCWFAFMVNG